MRVLRAVRPALFGTGGNIRDIHDTIVSWQAVVTCMKCSIRAGNGRFSCWNIHEVDPNVLQFNVNEKLMEGKNILYIVKKCENCKRARDSTS
jgi:predicted nucleic-acid-binding Zn-ribbon protein